MFQRYDIRDDAKALLKNSKRISEAIIRVLKPRTIVIGRDNRPSSKRIAQSIISHLLNRRVKVNYVGLISTPGLYFLSRRFDVGLMITASHLPLKMNGLKIVYRNAVIGMGNGLESIEKTYKKLRFINSKDLRISEDEKYKKQYLNFLKKKILDFRINKNQRVLIDARNNSGKIYKELINAKWINVDEKPKNPNPLNKAIISNVKRLLIKNRFRIGFIFDGDADRLITINRNGLIPPDFVGGLIALTLKHKRNEKVIVDVRTSQGVISELEKNDYHVILSRCGHSYIMQNMKKHKALIGFETSGHYYFRDTNYFDNAFLALLHVLKIKKELNIDLEIERFRYYNCIKDVNLLFSTRRERDLFMKKVKDLFQNPKKALFIDGYSFYFNDYWLNIRSSNTEPVVRIRIEAVTKEICERIIREMKKII